MMFREMIPITPEEERRDWLAPLLSTRPARRRCIIRKKLNIIATLHGRNQLPRKFNLRRARVADRYSLKKTFTMATPRSVMSDWLAGNEIGVDLISARLDSLVHRIDRLAAIQNTIPAANHVTHLTQVYFRKKTFSAMEPRPCREPNVFIILNHEDIAMAPYSSVYFKTELDFEAIGNIEATIIGHPIRFTEPPSVIPSHFVRQTPGRGLCLELYNYSHHPVLVKRGSEMALMYFTKIEAVVMQSRPQRNMAESPRFSFLANGTDLITRSTPGGLGMGTDHQPLYRRHPREEEIAAMFYIGGSSSSSSTMSTPSENEYDPGPPDPESPSYRPGTPDYAWTSSSEVTPTVSTTASTPPEAETQRTRLTRSPSFSSISSETSRLTPLGIRRAVETEGEDSNMEIYGSNMSVQTDTTTASLDEEDRSLSVTAVMLQEDLAYGHEDPGHQPRDDLPELEGQANLPGNINIEMWTRRWVRESMDLLNWVYLPETPTSGGNEDWGWN
jgi:hypothetical protein